MEREMGFTEVEADSQEMKFPSVTFCPSTATRLPREQYESGNITADYRNLPHVEDMLHHVRQKININKYER